MAYLGRRRIAIQLNGEFFVDGDSKFPGNRKNCLPASLGIRTEILAFDQGDSRMSQPVQMFQREVRAEIVVQNDVRDSLDVAMAGDGDSGNVAIAAVDRIHGNDSLRRALPEKMRILVD